MSVNGVGGSNYSYTDYSSQSNSTASSSATEQNDKASEAAVYESGKATDKDSSKKIYKRDDVTINRLNADLDYRKNQLQGLVEKLLLKQGDKDLQGKNMYDLLRTGKLNVDSATAAQAQADIGEDGYWGVEQTSDRLFDMAIALSGGDPDQADKMIDAMKKGFKQAEKAWGGKLPDISQQTIDAAIQKMEDWQKSFE